MTVTILEGDVRTMLQGLAAKSVQCVITSPPYWGLRDYDMPGQIGLEQSPALFVETMVDVFREVRRVLRDDGTLWLNLGDSYSDGGRGGDTGKSGLQGSTRSQDESKHLGLRNSWKLGLRPKNLLGMPWRVAFGLQDDGWYLRQDIIWAKPNAMPESVTDRCTKSHEYMFLLSKSARYHFDAEAIAEGRVQDEDANGFRGGSYTKGEKANDQLGRRKVSGNKRVRGVPPRHAAYPESSDQPGLDAVGRGMGRNRRSVWTIATAPFKEAHFATFPPALVEPCILAGCPEGGVVLDPFGGAGTTGLVADRLGRNALLIELNPEYAAIARRRINGDAPLFSKVA